MSQREFLNGRVTLMPGDCREVLATLPEASVDSVVCDPPYGIDFMGKGWDSFGRHRDYEPRGGYGDKGVLLGYGRGGTSEQREGYRRKSNISFQEWCHTWAVELFRVLKPGAHLVAFSGTRTYHRMACAIEDAGFEIRDQIGWAYGSGFPKSLDVSKAIDRAAGAERELIAQCSSDGVVRKPRETQPGGGNRKENYTPTITAPATEAAKQWEGWGTALKPAWEPIVLARKPLVGTVAENVLRYGTGALNIDATRIPTDGADRMRDPAPALLLCGLGDVQRSELAPVAYSISDKIPSRVDEHSDCILGTLSSWREREGAQSHRIANGPVCAGCSSLIEGSQFDCQSCRRSRDALLRQAEAAGLWPFPSRHGVHDDSAHLRKGWSRIREYLCSDHRANWDDFLGCVSCDTYIQRPTRNQAKSRWPANICHDGSPEVMEAFPDADGQLADISPNAPSPKTGNIYGKMRREGEASANKRYTDNGSTNFAALPGMRREDSGSAARFFASFPADEDVKRFWYGSKADGDDRLGSSHPTVKPIALMQWLVRLVTPRNGTVLDCFAGTGTTGEAAWREGMRAILVEREPEYIADIERRMELAANPTKRAAVAKTKNQLDDPNELPLFKTECAS